MCWNQQVSFNTFLFSTFVLGLVIYNNKYTQYKIEEFNNPYVYLFLFSVFSMQLVEFFIWRNLNNKSYIRLFSSIGILLLFLHPLFSVMMISDLTLRWQMLSYYLLLSVPMIIYKFYSNDYTVKLGKNGHLIWDSWLDNGLLLVFKNTVYLFFTYFSFIVEKKYLLLLFSFLPLIWSIYEFSKLGTFSSMWCWSINSLSIFVAFLLLIYYPFLEKTHC